MSDMDAVRIATLFHRLQTAADDSFTGILGAGEGALRTLRGLSYRLYGTMESPDLAQAINSCHDLIQKQLIAAAEEISRIPRDESYRLKALLWGSLHRLADSSAATSAPSSRPTNPYRHAAPTTYPHR